MPNYPLKKFEDCLERITYTSKIQRKDFLGSWKFPIVSQEMEPINGYWGSEKDVFKIKKPVVIFWDHTQVIKYIDFDFVLGADGVKILQPKDFLNTKYLYYFLQSIELKSLGYARHYRLLKELVIPLPPLSVQEEIVAKLDTALASIDEAKTKTQQALAATQELWKSTLNEIFISLSDSYNKKLLKEICLLVWGWTPSKLNSSFYDGDILWATVRDMKFDIIENTEYKISPEAVKKSSTNIIPSWNVIIATRVGLWKVCKNKYNVAINQDLRWVIPKDERKLLSNYVFWWFKNISHLIAKEWTGATVKWVKLPFIQNLQIPLPPFPEQYRIVAHLDTVRAESDRLSTLYEQKLRDLDELRRSVLQEAFAQGN